MANVRIDDATHETLKKISERDGVSITELLSEAVWQHDRDRFWKNIEATYEAMTPEEHEAEAAEQALWDNTLMDGLMDEPPWAAKGVRSALTGRDVMSEPLRRGDVITVRLGNTSRAGLVLSSDGFNAMETSTIIVLPIIHRVSALDSRVPLTAKESGLEAPSWVVAEQTRSIEKGRIIDHTGHVGPTAMTSIERIVCFALDVRR